MEKNQYGMPTWVMGILCIAMILFYVAGSWNSYRNSKLVAMTLEEKEKNDTKTNNLQIRFPKINTYEIYL